MNEHEREAERERWRASGDGGTVEPAGRPRRDTGGSVASAVVAGIVAVLAGGVLWGLVAKWTGYEFGVLAWAMGLLAGLAVLMGAGGKKNEGLQAIAIVAAALGILVGKYLAFALTVQDEMERQGTSSVGLFSRDMLDFFRDNLGDVFGVFDVLWIALAVGSAWWLLRPRKAEPVSQPEPEPVVVHARRRSRNPIDRMTERLPAPWRIIVDWTVTIVVAIGAVLGIKASIVNPYRIPSSSMETSLHCARPQPGCEARFSDRVLANRFIYHFKDPDRGDIIVFETPPQALERCGAGGTFVKRLVGLPGETIEERGGVIFIDGKKLDEPYIGPSQRDEQDYGPTKIPRDSYFMMGDNRAASCDSRVWGPVARENLIGEVFAVYWPPQRIGFR